MVVLPAAIQTSRQEGMIGTRNTDALVSVEINPGTFLKESSMPAKSKKQQMAAGAALAAKKGERNKSALKGASKGMNESMSTA